MKKIILKNTQNADSRTADENLTLETLREATEQHINEVNQCMDMIGDMIKEAGKNHDWTKLDNFEKEYGPLVLSGIPNEEFIASDWHNRHIFTERHHITWDPKPDMNLIDVIEHICDVVCAGKGRSGRITSKNCEMDPKQLYRAYWNTVKLVDDNTELENDIVSKLKIHLEVDEPEMADDKIKMKLNVYPRNLNFLNFVNNTFDLIEDMESKMKEAEEKEYYDEKIAYGYLSALSHLKMELKELL